MNYQTPDLRRRAFASTNARTIAQRVGLLQELGPEARAIAERCCGDCSRQWHTYTGMGTNFRFLGLDIGHRTQYCGAQQSQKYPLPRR